MKLGRFWLYLWIALSIGATLAAAPYDLVDLTPTNHDWRPAAAHLTLGQAAHIAEVAALKQGVSLANFLAPRFHYTPGTEHPYWAVFYEGKSGVLGDHFLVSVDDQTGIATFMPGE
jgi:hypothetical protein